MTNKSQLLYFLLMHNHLKPFNDRTTRSELPAEKQLLNSS